MRRLVGADVIRVTPALWSLVLAVLMLGGALGPGFVLSYDMVWVPDLAVRSDFLGLGSGLPRAVPSDLVVSVLDEVVPGILLQKAVLTLTLVLAGVGAWRMVPGGGWVAACAATTLYVWNPFVVERLAIGHWPLLMTYASLPWIHVAARRWVSGEPMLPQLTLWLAFASLSPAGGVIAAVFAAANVAAPRRGSVSRLSWTAAVTTALNAPWIVAGALHGSDTLSDPLGVRVFAAQGEGLLPTLPTLLGLGGIWNAEVVPVSRTQWPGLVVLVIVLVVAAAGVVTWRRWTTRSDRVSLVVPAVIGIGVALAGSTMPGAVEWLVARVPGLGLVRDGSRWVALLAPLEVMLFALGVARLAAIARSRLVGVAVATGLILAPVSLMPDAALGLSGQLGAVSLPEEFEAARQALVERQEAGRGDGDLLVLPFTTYRRPGWNDGRRTLDPIGRYFPVNYLASDTLVVSGRRVAGEDERARRVERLLETLQGAELQEALTTESIRWVVLDREAARAVEGAPDAPAAADLGTEGVFHEGTLLTLWELPEPENAQGGATPAGTTALVLLFLAWASALGSVAAAGIRVVRRRLASSA